MKPGVFVTITVGLILIVGAIMALQKPVEEAPIDEIRARIETSDPAWANYLEDLKAQIGSSPVAKWRGTIAQARTANGQVHVDFAAEGYWLEHQIAIPMLVRDNLGHVTMQTDAAYDGETLTYTFQLEQQAPPPWVEIQFPGNSRRIVFGAEGRWNPPNTQ